MEKTFLFLIMILFACRIAFSEESKPVHKVYSEERHRVAGDKSKTDAKQQTLGDDVAPGEPFDDLPSTEDEAERIDEVTQFNQPNSLDTSTTEMDLQVGINNAEEDGLSTRNQLQRYRINRVEEIIKKGEQQKERAEDKADRIRDRDRKESPSAGGKN